MPKKPQPHMLTTGAQSSKSPTPEAVDMTIDKQLLVQAKKGLDEDLLLPKQRIVALEYLVDYHIGNAADRAGVSRYVASEYLKKPAVKTFIAKRREAIEARIEVNVELIVEELRRILTADISEALDENGAFLPLHEWPVDLRRALAGINNEELMGRDDEGNRILVGQVVKVKFWNKNKSAELLLKKLNAFAPDKSEEQMSFKELIEKAEEARTDVGKNAEQPPVRSEGEAVDGDPEE